LLSKPHLILDIHDKKPATLTLFDVSDNKNRLLGLYSSPLGYSIDGNTGISYASSIALSIYGISTKKKQDLINNAAAGILYVNQEAESASPILNTSPRGGGKQRPLGSTSITPAPDGLGFSLPQNNIAQYKQSVKSFLEAQTPDFRFVHEPEPAYAASQNLPRKEHTMADLTASPDPRNHRLAVEYLERLLSIQDPQNRLAYHNDFTQIAAFSNLKDLPDFPRLSQQYQDALQAYRQDYPDQPPPAAPPRLTAIPIPTETPSVFLSKAAELSTPEEYRAYYQDHFNSFTTGEIRQVSPGMLALFSGRHSLPLALAADQNPYRAALYKQADEHGIAVEGLIPDPDDIDLRGMDLARQSHTALQTLLDPNAAPDPAGDRLQLEYLEMLQQTSPDKRQDLHRSFAAITDFQKLAAFPRFDDLDTQYRELRDRYLADHPANQPPFYHPGRLADLSQLSPGPTALQFLETASQAKSPAEYRALYDRHYGHAFPTAQVRMVSPDTIALFTPPQKLPAALRPFSPDGFSSLYRLANHNGIVPFLDKSHPLIPSPDEADAAGGKLITERLQALRDLLSPDYHARRLSPPKIPPHPAPPEPPPDPAQVFVQFVKNPCSPGVNVPSFGVLQNDNLKLMEGYSFLKTEDSGHTVCLSKRGGDGLPQTVRISKTHYDFIVNAANAPAASKSLTPEIIQTYEQTVRADVDKTRPNTAANFWHNYRVLARREALNPADAVATARRICSEMSLDERDKFNNSLAAFEKTRGQSYNDRVTQFYDKIVRDIPLENRSPHDALALAARRHNDDTVNVPGKPIDRNIRLKSAAPSP
jgi:hypothetical protein